MIEYEVKKTGPLHKKVPVYKEETVEGSKAIRTENVKKLIVTISTGKTFDADEESQTRMTRTVNVLEWNNIDSTEWVLADNTTATVTIDEFKEALTLALQEQANLWFS